MDLILEPQTFWELGENGILKNTIFQKHDQKYTFSAVTFFLVGFTGCSCTQNEAEVIAHKIKSISKKITE